MQSESLEPSTRQEPGSPRTGWQKLWDVFVAPFLASLFISIGLSISIELSQGSEMVRWEQVFGVVALAYFLGFPTAPIVAHTAMDNLTIFPVLGAQYLVVLILVVAGFIFAARLRSRPAKIALRTVCITLPPWSSLMVMGPYV